MNNTYLAVFFFFIFFSLSIFCFSFIECIYLECIQSTICINWIKEISSFLGYYYMYLFYFEWLRIWSAWQGSSHYTSIIITSILNRFHTDFFLFIKCVFSNTKHTSDYMLQSNNMALYLFPIQYSHNLCRIDRISWHHTFVLNNVNNLNLLVLNDAITATTTTTTCYSKRC